jgi:hypothetical protein
MKKLFYIVTFLFMSTQLFSQQTDHIDTTVINGVLSEVRKLMDGVPEGRMSDTQAKLLFSTGRQFEDTLYTVKPKPFPLGLIFVEEWMTINNHAKYEPGNGARSLVRITPMSHSVVNAFEFRWDFLLILLGAVVAIFFSATWYYQARYNNERASAIGFWILFLIIGAVLIWINGVARGISLSKLSWDFGTYITLYVIISLKFSLSQRKRYRKKE